MDASSYFQYAIIVLCGFLCAFYVNRRIASYPYKQVHDMFTNNPISNHYGSNQDIIAVVTGSTSGLGEGIASELFKYGFTVIIASRNYEKSMRVIDDIRCKYPGSAGRLIFSKLDTSDLQSVGQFSFWFSETFDHLDYLVNNAGIQYGSIENNPLFNTSAAIDSSQGYDLVFATNYMGHFLLTHLMFHHLSVHGRIVNIASSFHFQSSGMALRTKTEGSSRIVPPAAVGHDDDGTPKGFQHRSDAYSVSKLAQVLHVKELQRRISHEGQSSVKCISVCPGWVQTNILSSDWVGRAIKYNSYKVQDGILSAMGAMFDPSLHGGEFVANQILISSRYSWFRSLLQFTTIYKLREPLVLLLAIVQVFTQSQSYGYHVHESSPESYDTYLQTDLYEWTLRDLIDKGYIVEPLSGTDATLV